MEQSKKSQKEEFSSVADYLLDKEDEILKKWEEQIISVNKEPSAIASLSKDEFHDSIPDFIKALCQDFKNEKVEMEKVSRKHGSHRWEFGINLPLLTDEWSSLYFILLDYINEARDKLNLSTDLWTKTHKRLAMYVHNALKNSVDQYFNLEKRKAEARVGDIEEILEDKTGKLKERGENLQQASHDLGGSMVVVKMNLSMLKQTELSEEARELVDQLSMASENLSQLLDNLLNLFRLEAGREKLQVEEFDVAELLGNLAKNMESLAHAKNLELLSEGNEELKVKGDPLKVKRIAQNIILNSLKYTKTGSVKISWKKEDKKHWSLSIEDTGPGIDATNTALFANTTDGRVEYVHDYNQEEKITPGEVKMHSEGIGLLIVRQLCELLDGVVKVEGRKGEGTIFQIVFPVDY